MSKTKFHRDLDRFGPERSFGPVDRSTARIYCRRLAQRHYENFTVVSLTLPRRLMQHFYNIYAYCRWADDLGDETGGGNHALQLLRWWREELLACHAGSPHHPVMVALHDTIREFSIPVEPFLDLLFAFEQDQLIKRYQTLPQLLEYCRHSANPVGHLVLYLGRCFNAERAALANHICTALQLTNFWQDVNRDLDIGRVYLPAAECSRFAYARDDLANRRYNDAFRDLMAWLVQYARDLFHQGLPLIGMLPHHLQTEIDLFAQGGLCILRKIERRQYNVWHKRPVLNKTEKLLLMGRAALQRIGRPVGWLRRSLTQVQRS